MYSACGPFTKNKERIKRFKETGDSRYINQNELDKACFQHDMVYGNFKDLNRRTAAHKVLSDKAFDIAEDQKCDDINMCLLQCSINVLIKNIPSAVLGEELQKPITRKLNKRKVHSPFIDNIWVQILQI